MIHTDGTPTIASHHGGPEPKRIILPPVSEEWRAGYRKGIEDGPELLDIEQGRDLLRAAFDAGFQGEDFDGWLESVS